MGKFFIPGPSWVCDEILREQSRPMIGHRSKAYAELQHEVVSSFKNLFNWHNYHVFLVTSSATGVMEGVIRNCVHKNVLHTECGAFSERWSEVSEMNDKEVTRLIVPWGQVVKPETVKEFLRKQSMEAICFTHCETSTGVLNPLKELCEAVRSDAPETLIFVDGVSAFGGVPIEVEEWGIDVLLFGTQKCLALPPGLAIGVVSQRAFEKSLGVKNRGAYFNFETFAEYDLKNNTPATPPVSLIYALRLQLERIKQEGVQERFKRHKDMFDLVNLWVKDHGFSFFSERGYQSPTVSAICKKDGIEIAQFVSDVKQQGFVISDGYGKLKGETFRIGHMGDLTVSDLKQLLKTMSMVLGFNDGAILNNEYVSQYAATFSNN